MLLNIPTCNHLELGLLPHQIGLTPCTCNIIDISICTIALLFLLTSIYQTRQKYDFVFPNFNPLFRTKLVLSFLTILTEITLLLFLLTNTSLRSEFLSVLAITSSTIRLLTWITQTCLMYILHWRAIQSSWLNLRSFWAVWFLTSCITTISFLNILLSDVTAKPDVMYRQIYFSIIAVQGLASSGLAICIFLPNDIGDYSSILKYISSNQYDAIESGSSNSITGSLNAPFLRNGINSNYNHYNNAGHGVIHSPTRKYTSYNGRNVQFQEESKKMNNNENSSYAKTQPISTNVNYSNESDSYLSQSNGSQSGISLEQNASLKTKNKKKNDILKKKGKKNKKRDLKERNIWDR